ncbi:uncharacterized protein LOC125276038 isoform X5 [Megalobrama amblycephala]|uniref:uncharacterized protein LOC125265388 n=1 Tax=Megalobrama amblycephala TaxID=75352 RepID=UPI002013F1DF|nr:uncharacterized protein LOC125265388 [Megalobrama amblycephala]XP_048059397.1 uncharacterized protein LOC125276038 isoform X5 [Megalobrama amblycephala]
MLNLLLLLCLVYHSESSSISVTGIKGGRVTLSCDFEDREILVIHLISRSEIISVCQEKNCSGRVFKEGSCDVIIKDLIFSDAGKYFLRVYYYNDQRELEYHLHIHDEISVETGEQLKMDVLLINADKVEKNSSGEWTEVWTRGHGVSSDRLTDRDGNLTISNFTVSDTGTYRVLDSEGEILITVTVTESKGNLKNTDEDETDSEHHSYWIVAVVLTVILILAAVVLHKHLLRDHDQSVCRRREEELRSGDPEALEVYNDLCRGSGEHDQTLQGSGHTVTSLDNTGI